MKRPCGDAAIALLGAGPAAPGAGRPRRPFVPFTVHCKKRFRITFKYEGAKV